MSRGLGRLERTILDEITKADARAAAKRGRRDYWPLHVTLHSLHHDCFPSRYMPERGCHGWTPDDPVQRKAVWRALRSVLRKYPQYAVTGGQGRKGLIVYDPADPVSTYDAATFAKSRKESIREFRMLRRRRHKS
jgi:hypothetical protein